LLFQYSALGFNSHRIHTSREHARQVEGFPDLVVNGGLATLLLTEFLRCELGLRPTAIQVKHLAPLFCDRPMTLTADPVGASSGATEPLGQRSRRWLLKAFDDQNRLAVEMQSDVEMDAP
jgi:3-methylfumaryl-CoA hydratase